MKITVTSTLPASQDKVWELLLKTDILFYVSKGWVEFTDRTTWPLEWSAGQVIDTTIKPFGWGEGIPYKIMVTEVIHNIHTIRTQEHGGPAKSWNHTMQVRALGRNKCLYTDEVEVDGGLKTPSLAAYVWCYYHGRHRRWRKLLKQS